METRPSVVHVITQLELGGAQRNTLFTVASLDRSRFLPSLICGPGGVLDEEARALDVPVTFVPSLVRPIDPLRDLRALQDVRAALQAHGSVTAGPLIVHTHSSKAGVVGRMAGKQLRGTTVHSVHGFGFHDGQPQLTRRALALVEKVLAPITDAMIFVSRRDMETAEQLRLIRRGQGNLIRSGINLSAFHPDARARREVRAELGLDDNARVIITVANFKAQKNPLVGLRAFARVLEAEPNARWIFCGDGELRPQFDDEAQRLGVAHHIQVMGWRKDIPRVLNAGDLYLLSGDHEGLPRSVLEALSVGLPVAATDAGGTREVVVPGTGLVVPVGDWSALGDAALTLLRSPPDVHHNAATLLAEFDIHRMVQMQEALYTRLLHAG